MADPVQAVCTQDTWVKVATNVTAGQVWLKDFSPGSYLQTYVDTGGAAPVGDGLAIEFIGIMMPISASVGIDVYIKAVGAAGLVRVDL